MSIPPKGPGRVRSERFSIARLIAQNRCAIMRLPLGKTIIAHGAQSARSDRAPDCASVSPAHADAFSAARGIPAATAHKPAAINRKQGPVEAINAVAGRVARLRPDWQRLERFFSQSLQRHGYEPIAETPGHRKKRGCLVIAVKTVDTSDQWQNRMEAKIDAPF